MPLNRVSHMNISVRLGTETLASIGLFALTFIALVEYSRQILHIFSVASFEFIRNFHANRYHHL